MIFEIEHTLKTFFYSGQLLAGYVSTPSPTQPSSVPPAPPPLPPHPPLSNMTASMLAAGEMDENRRAKSEVGVFFTFMCYLFFLCALHIFCLFSN